MHHATAEHLSHFRYTHLRNRDGSPNENLQAISKPFAVLAVQLVGDLPEGPALTRCLGHLRRAKDEAVTAHPSLAKSGDELIAIAEALIADIEKG